MLTTKPDTDTGWTTEFAALSDGWYWSRKPSLPRPRKDVLHVVNSQVAFGAMWLRPDKDPMFFENREWLGPIRASDFEQLIRLRKVASDAAQWIESQAWPCQHSDQPMHCTRCATRAKAKELVTALREALAPVNNVRNGKQPQ